MVREFEHSPDDCRNFNPLRTLCNSCPRYDLIFRAKEFVSVFVETIFQFPC